VLEGIEHPGILRVLDYKDTERGPALIFEHDPKALRLDHFARERGSKIGTEGRLDLLRQIAEAIQYAHEKRLYPHSRPGAWRRMRRQTQLSCVSRSAVRRRRHSRRSPS